MKIDEILRELKQLEISKDEFYVEGNAALVIRGIIPDTDNIKVCMSSDAIKTLENTYKLTTKDSKHYMFGKLYIRECKKSCFDMEECEPYNIESICKRLYILLESSNEAEALPVRTVFNSRLYASIDLSIFSSPSKRTISNSSIFSPILP